MAMKLYVGNLSYNVNNSELEQMFTPFGTVQSASIITDRETGRSKGFGFLAYADEKSFERALRGLDGLEIDGREVRASRHQEKEGGSHNGLQCITCKSLSCHFFYILLLFF